MKALKILLISSIICIAPMLLLAQGGPPEPPGDHNQDGNQDPPASAPIASGLTIMLTLGAVYGGTKVRQLLRAKKEDN